MKKLSILWDTELSQGKPLSQFRTWVKNKRGGEKKFDQKTS